MYEQKPTLDKTTVLGSTLTPPLPAAGESCMRSFGGLGNIAGTVVDLGAGL